MLSDLLMWNKIGRIVMLLAKRLRISPERAFDLFYTSETNASTIAPHYSTLSVIFISSKML